MIVLKEKLQVIEKIYFYFFWITFLMVNPPFINFFNKPEMVGGILPKLFVWVYFWYFVALIGFGILGSRWINYIKEI